jgi:hypothetical protein
MDCRIAVFLVIASNIFAGDSSQADLRELIRLAVTTGRPQLVIPPGIYRMGPRADDPIILTVRKARDLEIVADGVTIIATKRMRALMFEQCENVILRGLTLDYDPLTFTQGKIIAIAPDKDWFDVAIDAGYPQLLLDRIVICDPRTRFHKYGINHLWGTKATWAKPGIVRVTRREVARNVDLGDLVALSGGQEAGVCHGITVENQCSNVTFRNVTIHCAPGMGVVDANNETGIRMLDCKIVAGPRPAGATEDRLLTTSWDGIQCNATRVGPQIENCRIERCGDDSWSVTARELKVVQRDGLTLQLRAPSGSPAAGGLRNGDRLVLRSQQGPVVRRIETLRPIRMELEGKPATVIETTLDQELPIQPGDVVFNLDCASRGFVYRNNSIRSHGRGALIKTSDGLVEGNTFFGSDKAVMVNPESGWGGCDRLIIRGNTVVETGYHQAMPWSEQAGAVCLSSSKGGALRPPGVFNDILIENNTFERVKGLNLFISSTRNVTVKNNRFLHTHRTDPGRHNGADYGIDTSSVILVTQSDGVDFHGNVIEQPGPFSKQAVLVTSSALNVHNADSGVRIERK